MSNRQWIYIVIIQLCVTALSLGVYERFWNRPHQPRYVVVDILTLMNSEQDAFAKQVINKDATEDDRKAALTRAQAFGRAMDTELASISAECNCIILNKAAVVSDSFVDMTPILKKKLNLKD